MAFRKTLSFASAMLLSGCAFQTQVQRFGVEYNEALASMANEQALLNILRASKGMPTHFTSVSRFTGTLTAKASGSVNGQLRGSGLTSTSTTGGTLSTATTVASGTAMATGATTTNSVVTTPGSSNSIVDAVAEGVDVYNPQIGGELSSGTAFDVQVYDQQKFYQGILSAVPFSTVETLINQGFEPDLIASLLIARIDFYKEDPKTKGKKLGDAVASYRNDPSDRARFERLIDCNALDVAEFRSPETKLAPLSRLGLGGPAGKDHVTLEQLALLDGTKLSLSDAAGMAPDGGTDATVFVVKPGSTSRIPKLLQRSCAGMPPLAVPSAYRAEAAYLGGGFAAIGKTIDGVMKPVSTPVVFEIVFRSPEAVLRAVGQMVRTGGVPPAATLGICPGGGTDCEGKDKKREPIFAIEAKRDRKALLATRFMHTDYSIPESGYRSMQVISIIEQLINLQKEASENAVSVPVRAVP